MANEKDKPGVSNATLGMMVMAVVGAIVCGASFWVIKYWPLPVAVAPYYEDNLFLTGAAWGFVVGAVVGWLIGWMTDEKHFAEPGQY